jgi:hypothetical protein
MRQRQIAVFSGVVLTVIMVAALLDLAANRLGSLFGEENMEAKQSADLRNHLFRQSLTYTFQHPLFGVGPGQVSNYMSQEHEVKQAMWHPTHCAWTQVSSECGMPGSFSSFWVLDPPVLAWAAPNGSRGRWATPTSPAPVFVICWLWWDS